MELLSAKGIVKKYANHIALNDIDISIQKQSIFGLLGPNGAGKTSLIRIINQITAPDKGEVFFKGQKLEPDHSRYIGYLPEERGLYKKMEVGEQALYLAQLKGMSRHDALKKLKEWFIKFEMQNWWNKKIEELSKGMQQKVQFITTVLHEPELLILDEPFSGFDPVNANLIKEEIFKLRDNGATILFSTHSMGSVEELCDSIALINKSKKVLDGEVKKIKKQFNTNIYELEFTGNILAFTNALWSGAEILNKYTEGETHKVKLKLLGKNTSNDLISAILPYSNIISFKEVVPTMNEIFIHVVGSEANENKFNKAELTE